MTMTSYFFDSYALIEILKASENYSSYINKEVVVTKLNLFEVYYKFLELSKEKADIFLKIYSPKAVDFDEVVISEACKLKLANKKLSITDCIGYVTATKLGINFLTGDKEFEGIKNVEFVK